MGMDADVHGFTHMQSARLVRRRAWRTNESVAGWVVANGIANGFRCISASISARAARRSRARRLRRGLRRATNGRYPFFRALALW